MLNLFVGLSFLAIIYYAIFAYKRPHGNELKYIFLLTGFLTLIKSLFELVGRNNTNEITTSELVITVFQYASVFMAIILMAYVAGRLDRIKENKVIFIVVLGLIIVSVVITYIKGAPSPAIDSNMSSMPASMPDISQERLPEGIKKCFMQITRCDIIIQYISLMAAYLSRYALHKEAGMQDR